MFMATDPKNLESVSATVKDQNLDTARTLEQDGSAIALNMLRHSTTKPPSEAEKLTRSFEKEKLERYAKVDFSEGPVDPFLSAHVQLDRITDALIEGRITSSEWDKQREAPSKILADLAAALEEARVQQTSTKPDEWRKSRDHSTDSSVVSKPVPLNKVKPSSKTTLVLLTAWRTGTIIGGA